MIVHNLRSVYSRIKVNHMKKKMKEIKNIFLSKHNPGC